MKRLIIPNDPCKINQPYTHKIFRNAVPLRWHQSQGKYEEIWKLPVQPNIRIPLLIFFFISLVSYENLTKNH